MNLAEFCDFVKKQPSLEILWLKRIFFQIAMKRPAAQTAQPKKVLKKPALAKKPALKEEPPLKEEEEPEEEAVTEDMEVEAEVTQENLKTHQQLLDAKLVSVDKISQAVENLPPKEQQLLWKKKSRKRE